MARAGLTRGQEAATQAQRRGLRTAAAGGRRSRVLRRCARGRCVGRRRRTCGRGAEAQREDEKAGTHGEVRERTEERDLRVMQSVSAKVATKRQGTGHDDEACAVREQRPC